MSDAMTGIARDQNREHLHNVYLFKLAEHLVDRDSRTVDEVREAAAEVDYVGRGYWGGRTQLGKAVEQRIALLTQADKMTWAELLLQVKHSEKAARNNGSFKKWGCGLYDKLRSISPWPGVGVVLVPYMYGIYDFDGLKECFDRRLRVEGVNITGSCVLIFDTPIVEVL
jgi:hypothetical protein